MLSYRAQKREVMLFSVKTIILGSTTQALGAPKRRKRCMRISRRPVLHRPLQQLQVSFLLGEMARPIVPRAVMRPRPLQNLQAPAVSGECACPRIPWAVVLPKPFQHLQVSALSGECTAVSV
jgi:hypothetical protein